MGYPAAYIIVNDFYFCLAHGHEHCPACFYDHRPTNVYGIRQHLLYPVRDDRPSINVYDYGAVPAPPTPEVKGNHNKGTYQCRDHHRIDCKACFDWVGFLNKAGPSLAPESDRVTSGGGTTAR